MKSYSRTSFCRTFTILVMILALTLIPACQRKETPPATTDIHDAVMRGDLKSLEYIVKNDVKQIEKKEGEKGNTPLHIAGEKGNNSAVEILLKAGADKNSTNNRGLTPLHTAIANEKRDTAILLINSGADCRKADKDKLTPLHYASFNGDPELVRMIAEKGADTEIKDLKNMTPLHHAVNEGHKEVALFLIEKGANVNQKADNDVTPLHMASFRGDREMVEMLLKNKADVNAKNRFNSTPMDVAINAGHYGVVEVLRSSGAKSSVPEELKEEMKKPLIVKGMKVTDRGIYEMDKQKDSMKQIEETRVIPCRVGITFGFRFIVEGSPKYDPVDLEMVLNHPPLDDGSGKTSTRTNAKKVGRVGFQDFAGWSFADGKELVPGKYRFQILYQGKCLGEEEFDIKNK